MTPKPSPFSSVWWSWLGAALWLAGAGALVWWGYREGWTLGTMILVASFWVFVAVLLTGRTLRGLFGPVFLYEITRLGRRKSTYIFRLIYILGLMALLGFRYLIWLEEMGYFAYSNSNSIDSQKLSAFATEFFFLFSGVQILVVSLLTPVYVAGCIADEKERKTLEFLLATDLNSAEIVFGKMAARVLTLLMYVLAGLPIVGFLQLFGGIDPELLLISTAVSIITIIGFSAVSVFCSVNLLRPRDAIIIAYVLILLYLCLSAVTGGYLLYLSKSNTFANTTLLGFDGQKIVDGISEGMNWLAGGNLPFQTVFVIESMARGAGLNPAVVGGALLKFALFWIVATAILLAVCFLRLRPIALAQRDNAPRKLSNRKARNRPECGNDPMAWKEVFIEGRARTGCLGALVNIAMVALVFFVPVLIFFGQFGDMVPLLDLIFTFANDGRTMFQRYEAFSDAISAWVRSATAVLSAMTFLMAAIRGAGSISNERDRDTWISLISTPLSAWDMIRGKWIGCLFGLRKMYFALILVWSLGLLVGAVQPMMIPACVIALFVYISAFCWLGVFFSIHARNTLIASIRALLASFFLGGGFWIALGICCCLPLGTLSRSTGDDLGIEYFGIGFAGLTPPVVMFMLPLNHFNAEEAMFFSEREGILAPLSPLFGIVVWGLFAWFMAFLSYNAFASISNRDEALKLKLSEQRR